MKKYYVKYWNNFGNCYRLHYAETGEEAVLLENDDFSRITRAEALRLCVQENDRRKRGPAFSGFADNLIFPVNCPDNWINDWRHYFRDGYFVIRKNL